MTHEEAIRRILDHIRIHSKQEPFRAVHITEALEMAVDALKAQEPKPPVVKENSYGWKFYYCPSCGKEFYQNNKFCFCEKCGQAVKWE